MAAKIFVNYRRDDDPSGAARVRDGLAAKFGRANVFMDVDNLLAGQRFDEELAKALAACDVLIAIIGPRWFDLMQARAASGERDYVREEIAGALQRRLVVIPVRVGREGQLLPLPRPEDLPEDIRDLVLYQKHDVAHERFSRDIADLIEAIVLVRKSRRPQLASRTPAGWIAGGVAAIAMAGYAAAYVAGLPVPWPEPQHSPAPPRAAEETSAPKAGGTASVSRQDPPPAKSGTSVEDARAKVAAAKDARDEALAKIAAAKEKVAAAQSTPSALAAPLEPGQTFRDCTDGCPEMVVVPAGEFTMGSNDGDSDEKPPHRVFIRQPFAVGKFEVTFDEWTACVSGGGCTSNRSPDDEGWGNGRRPVINVSWNDAKEYVSWLSRKTGKTYRLLSEAEWEYAARAKTATRFSFDDSDAQLGTYAWYTSNSGGRTHPVGDKSPNALGLYDMHGNVWEWCEDTKQTNYQGAPTDGSAWLVASSSFRVLRGGSWNDDPSGLRSVGRGSVPPGLPSDVVGFRLARTL